MANGPGSKTKDKTRRKNSLALQQSLPGGRIARRATRRLLERQEAFADAKLDARPGFRKPGSMKGAA